MVVLQQLLEGLVKMEAKNASSCRLKFKIESPLENEAQSTLRDFEALMESGPILPASAYLLKYKNIFILDYNEVKCQV